MQARDLILVSVDDHLVEPPDVFDHHLPARYRDRAPTRRSPGRRLATSGSSTGRSSRTSASTRWPGRPREEYGVEPTAFDEMRPGCYDVHERIKDMNAGGVLGSMCFPSFPGFSARLFAAAADKELAPAVVRAYNDWHVDEWCGAYPGRFIPMGLPILWDPELCASEVRRLAAKGVHSLTFTENPAALGYPSFHEEHWDPLWRALCDEGVVLSIHLGSSGQLSVTAPDAPVDVMITLQPMNICQAAADLVWSRVIKSFPDIRIALSEGGTGWIPYFLDRLDRTYEMHHLWTGQDFGGRLPSEVFREHFLTCFIADPVGIELRHEIGLDNIAWECDYPHSDSSWPRAPRSSQAVAADVPDDELAKITYENAVPLVLLRPLRPPGTGALHGRRAAGGGGGSLRSRSAPTTRAASSAAVKASTSASWRSGPRPEPSGGPPGRLADPGELPLSGARSRSRPPRRPRPRGRGARRAARA